MALYPDQLDDLVNTTYNRSTRKQWVDLSLDNQDYVFAKRFMNGKNKTPVKGGPLQQWKLQTGKTGNARWSGMFSEDQTSVKNLITPAEQKWAMMTTSFSYDVNEEEFQGDDVTMIINEIKVREHDMYSGYIELMESALWTAPPSSTQDPRQMSGFPFWVQKSATEGFNGGNPTGFSDGAGGVNTTTVPNWKNYTFGYSGVTRDDLIAKWKRAVEFTKFKAPYSYPEIGGGEPNWMFYTTYRLQAQLQEFLDSRNDKITDLAGTGKSVFNSIPVETVFELENSTQDGYDSTDPIYGINWNTFQYFCQKGKDLVRQPPKIAPLQHTVRDVFMDSKGNMQCMNRRANFVGYAL
jgi:hypothetical protein